MYDVPLEDITRVKDEVLKDLKALTDDTRLSDLATEVDRVAHERSPEELKLQKDLKGIKVELN